MTTTNHHSNNVEAYKHRYRGHIFRPKAAAPFLVPSSSESEEDSSSTSIQEQRPVPTLWGSTATPTNSAEEEEEIRVELWRDEETRQADDDVLAFYQQMMDDMIQQAIRDIDLGNY